jgi:hypothetical protein
MDVQILDRDSRDNSILHNFAHSVRQNATVTADFSRSKQAQVFEASFSTESAGSGHWA